MNSFLPTHLRPALAVLLALTLITGHRLPGRGHRRRPGRVPVAGQRLAGHASTGGRSARALIGQAFDDPRYFWGRPSAAGAGYDGDGVGRLQPGPDQPAP